MQADTIIPSPGNPQSLNRYSYCLGNPVKYTDPSGHFTDDAIKAYLREQYGKDWILYWKNWVEDVAWMDMLYTAQAGDVFTANRTDGVLFCQFTGEGRDFLSGAIQLANFGRNPGMYDEVSLQSYKAGELGSRISDLIRIAGDVPQVIPTKPYLPENSHTYTTIGRYDYVTGGEAFVSNFVPGVLVETGVYLGALALGVPLEPKALDILWASVAGYFIGAGYNSITGGAANAGDEVIWFYNMTVTPSMLYGVDQQTILSQFGYQMTN